MTEKMTLAQALTQKGGRPRSRPRHVGGEMNKLEARYEAEVLKPGVIAGELLWYGFEKLKLRLAKATFYDTDFLVVTKDGVVEVHEVKGFLEDDAAVKVKVAADAFPFVFKMCRFNKGWQITEIG